MGRNKTIDDQRLLGIARDAFRERGHTATTRDVARAAGISQAALYQRFGSKEDLFMQAMMPELPDVDALLGPYSADTSKEDLLRLAERLADFFASMLPSLLQVVAHPDVGASQLKKWHSRLPFVPIVHALSERFRRMQADGRLSSVKVEFAAQTFVAAVHSVAILETMMGGHGPPRATKVRASVDVIWTGLAPSDSHMDDARAHAKPASPRRPRTGP